jgi:hypothetical protein
MDIMAHNITLNLIVHQVLHIKYLDSKCHNLAIVLLHILEIQGSYLHLETLFTESFYDFPQSLQVLC